MIRTYVLPCRLVRADADALNRESGRLYSSVLVQHWRIYHKHGLWLSPGADEKLGDFLTAADPPLLHPHSKDAAQQAFARACKTTRSLRAQGLTANFPHKRKYYRTTIWKNSAIRLRTAMLLLSRARGLAPISVDLPSSLAAMPRNAFVEVRLVYERCSSCYQWHLVVDDGQLPPPPPGAATVAVDMGEIHPAALTDGQTSLIISCRELRASRQYTAKRLSQLRSLMDRTHKGSRNWLRLKRRQLRFRAQQRRRIRDMEHKVSRAVVEYAYAAGAGTIAIGDVRNIADKGKVGKQQNQRNSLWAHGRVRGYISYKAAALGMRVVLVDEHHTTRTCPNCRQQHKPKGRLYRCPACGLACHRDAVGAANILSRRLYSELGRVAPCTPKYRFPLPKWVKRSPSTQGMWLG